jgi:hypothetical protein
MRLCPLLIFLCALSLSPSAEAAGALDLVAFQAAESLAHRTGSRVVVAAPLTSDEPIPKGGDLALRVAALIAGRVGPGARVHPQTAGLEPARSVAGRASTLVYVQTEISKGDLRVTVDIYPSLTNTWDRIRNPLPAPVDHAFASAKIDAEVRSFLSPLLLEQASVHRARHDESGVLAAACGDIDGDGGDEIVLVSRERIAMGRVRGSRFVVERTAQWRELALRAPVPVRGPLAGAAFGAGVVAVGLTERGSLSLNKDFTGRVPLPGVPAWGGNGIVCLTAEPSAGAFDGAPFDCSIAGDIKPKMAVPAPRFDAFAAGTITDSQGSAILVVAVREPSGKLKLKIGDATPNAVDGTFGAQVVVCDFDQDGVPEIASSGNGPEDAVDVWSWQSQTGSLRPRLHLPAPAGVRALALCPPEERGLPALVAVVGNDLWIVRPGVQEAPR